MDQKLPIHKNNKNRLPSLLSIWDSPFASPVLWNPARLASAWWNNDVFDTARRNMDLIFGDVFGNLPMAGIQRKADVTEDQNSLRVKMDVPGLEADDLDISTEDGMLIISADKEEKQDGTESRYSFSYSTSLPENADIDHANVSLANNKLNIEIPKRNGGAQQSSAGQNEQSQAGRNQNDQHELNQDERNQGSNQAAQEREKKRKR